MRLAACLIAAHGEAAMKTPAARPEERKAAVEEPPPSYPVMGLSVRIRIHSSTRPRTHATH